MPIWLRLSIAGTLVLLSIPAVRWVRDLQRQPAPDAPRIEFTVEGLDCPLWCAVRLTETIDGLDGARVERLDQKTGKVVVRHDPSRQNVQALSNAFEARGFAVTASESIGGIKPR